MKYLPTDHIWALVLSLMLLLAVVLVLSLEDKVIDDRLISGGVLVLIGAIANHARNN